VECFDAEDTDNRTENVRLLKIQIH
jgi:hypothetical protein